MAERTIKFRLFNYWEETGEKDVAGNPVLVARLVSFGETVDIPRDEDVKRGEKLGAFFSAEDAKAIKAGTYSGPQAALLSGRPQASGEAQVQDLGEIDVASASAEEIAEFINENRLNVQETLDLAGDDPDLAEKVLDAEGLATDSDPRVGVERGLEAIMARASQ